MTAPAARDMASAGLDDALAAAVLTGGGLPPVAEHHLAEAGRAFRDDALAEAHLKLAEAVAPDHAAVLIGLYRYYFYKGRPEQALEVAERCLAKAARDIGLARDWRQVAPGDARFDRYEEVLPRFFLFTLKGYAYLNMRLGRLSEGEAAIDKLLELDPSDRVGARVLFDVLKRIGADDDDD